MSYPDVYEANNATCLKNVDSISPGICIRFTFMTYNVYLIVDILGYGLLRLSCFYMLECSLKWI